MGSSELYSASDVVDLCHCHDGCMAPVVVVKNQNQKFQLYGCSEVFGMGAGKWEKLIIDDEFDEVIPNNSDSGISHISIRKDNVWGLIEIQENNTVACDCKLIADLKFKKNEIDVIRNARIKQFRRDVTR